jgi:two-component system response regulator LytT
MGAVKLLIVEDETVVAMDMADHLEDVGYEVVDTVIDYSGALEVLENQEVDFVLIDIMLGGSKDGIDLAKTIRERFDLPFIFLTSHSDKATVEAATATKPNGYLIKPFEVDHIYAAVEAAISNYSGNDKSTEEPEVLVKDSLFIKTDRLFVKVQISDILWFQSDGNYIKVVTSEHKHMIRSSFSSLLEKLPVKKFIKIHKSYYVNIDQVEAVNHTYVMINGHEIPLSRNYRDALYNSLNRIL